MSEWKGIWVFIEQDDGVIEESSLEVLSRARELADERGEEVTAVLLGESIGDAASKLGRHGAHKVILVEDPILKYYTSDPYSKIMARLIEERKPDSLILSATRNGRDLAGRLAVKFRTGLIAHVVSLDYDDEGLLMGKVPGFGGNIMAVVKCVRGRPQMATVTPGIFDVKEFEGEAEIEKVESGLDPEQVKTRVVDREIKELIDISKSEKVVIAGMGTGGRMELVNQLAELIGADIGVTRPLADMGLAPRDIQVGSTGVILKGSLAIVLGASGAPHFVSGIKDMGTVISINKDPEAPIYEYSDHYFVGDIFEILPLVLRKLKEG